MKKNMLVMSLLTLGTLSVAVADEYKTPEVGLRPRAIPSKEMKVSEFGDHYMVESGTTNDRQIASQEEDSERVPSSLKKEMPVEDENMPEDAPRPWLQKIESKNPN